MEQRVEHPVGPFELASGKRTYPLPDGVAVAFALRQNCEHEGVAEAATMSLSMRMPPPRLEVLCIEAQGAVGRKA